MQKLVLTTPFALGLMLMACGSNVPGTDQVKQDFENPTGSTKSKQSVAGAYAANNASASSSALAGGFSPFGGASASGALTQAGGSALQRARLDRMAKKPLALLQERATGQVQRALSAADVECGNDEIGAELQGDLQSGSTSGSFDVEIDLGACSNGELTGSVSMSGSYDIDTDDGSFVFEISQKMNNVCETSGDKVCVNGDYEMEATFANEKIQMVTGWLVTATWNDGVARSIESKGGLRIGFSGDDGTIEYLVYVTDENGEEVSLVLKLTSSAEGTGLEIRGNDGSITCTVAADGSGSCSGDLAWDAAFVDSLDAGDEG